MSRIVGGVKDPALQTLLRDLAAANTGLCVVTTRLAVDDLKDRVGATVRRLDLEHARLHLAQGDPDAARRHLDHARRLVEETGYARREPEVAQLEAELGGNR